MTEKSFIEEEKDIIKSIENQIKEDFKQYCINGNLLEIEKEFNNQKIRNIILNENNIDYYTQILEESLKHGLGFTNKLIPKKSIMKNNDKIILNLIKYLCKNGKCDLVRELIKNETVKGVLEDKENSYDLAVIIDSAYNSSGKEFVEELFDNLDLNICKILKHICNHQYNEVNEGLINLIINDENKIKKIKKEIKETKNLEEIRDKGGMISNKFEIKNSINDMAIIIGNAYEYGYKDIIEKFLKDEEIKKELFEYDSSRIVLNNFIRSFYFIYNKGRIKNAEGITDQKDLKISPEEAMKILINEGIMKESITLKDIAEALLNGEKINEEITAENAIEILLNNNKIKEKITADDLLSIFELVVNNNVNLTENILNIFYSKKNEEKFFLNLDKDKLARLFGDICRMNNNKPIITKIVENDKLLTIITEPGLFKIRINLVFFLNCINNKKENNDFLLEINEIKEKISTEEISKLFIQECKKQNNKEIIINLLNNEEITKRLNQEALLICFIELCKRGEKEIAETLLNNKSLFEKMENNGCFQTGFMAACENNQLELIKILINNEKIIKEIQDGVLNLYFLEACKKNNLDIVKEFFENKNLKNIININNKDLQNLFFNIITKEEKLNQKEIELSLLLLKNDIRIENEIDNNTYKKIIKNNIKDLVEKFGINKENFENIKNKEGYKEFIKDKKISKNYEKDWNSNSPSQKMLLSFIKIKDELKNQQNTYKTL